MRSPAKTLVTKSTRSSMKRMKSLLRKPPDRSARFVPGQPVFPTITDLCPPLSALLLPNRQSQLQGLRELSPHHPRSRRPSPSKRVMRSKHLDHTPLYSPFLLPSHTFHDLPSTYYRVAPPLHLSDKYRRLYSSFATALYILQTDIAAKR